MRYPALYGQLVKTYPSVKTVALFYDSALLGQTHVGFAQEAAKNAGLTVVATELYATDTKDFGPIVTRVLSQNPDAIDIGAAGSIPANFLALLKALNEQGYHKPMFGLSGAAATLAQAGAQAEGYFFQSLADYTSPAVTAGEKDLIQRYISKYGEGELDTLVVGAGTIVPVLAQAMVKANSVTDTALIAQTLRNAGPWDTLWGKKSFTGVKTFGIAANLDMNLYMTKYEGGKVITFDSFPATLP
jgi:branched-chain amino acid transport system substrate-binding protein